MEKPKTHSHTQNSIIQNQSQKPEPKQTNSPVCLVGWLLSTVNIDTHTIQKYPHTHKRTEDE